MEELENLIISALLIYKNPEIINDIIEFQKDLNTEIDKKFRVSLKEEKINIACEKGCAYCCYGWEVKGNIAELILAVYELNSLKLEEKKKILKNLRNYPKSKNLENVPCPLLNLEMNTCRIYNSRPFVCRLYVSEDVNKCKNKEEIVFPNSVEKITKNVKIPAEEMISDEFKPLFDTKMSITDILFNEEKNLFYLNLANTINLFVYPEDKEVQIKMEKGDYFKKFGTNF